jgi:hypothetical protein
MQVQVQAQVQAQAPVPGPTRSKTEDDTQEVDFASLRLDPRDQAQIDDSELKRESFYVDAHTDGFTCLTRLVEFLMLSQNQCRPTDNKLQALVKELKSPQTQALLRAKAAEASADHWSSNPFFRLLLKLCTETVEELNECERERVQEDRERREEREKLLWGDMIRNALTDPLQPQSQTLSSDRERDRDRDMYARKPGAPFELKTNQAAVNMMRQAVQGMGAVYQEHMSASTSVKQ